MGKIEHFEGLRGIAALVVVNEHLLKLFFFIAFSDAAMKTAGFGLVEQASFPPFNMLHNGAWAVCLFFVLSGYVLSNSFFAVGAATKKDLVVKIVTRYFRLAIPVAASLLLVWVLMTLGMIYYPEVIQLTQTKGYNPYSEPFELTKVITQGFGSTLFLDDISYNPALWTMSVEMIASVGLFLVQMFFLTFKNHQQAWLFRMVVYMGLVVLFFPTLYVGFILGMLLCDIKNEERANTWLKGYAHYWAPASIMVGILLCGYMVRGIYTNPYTLITVGEYDVFNEYLYNTWGAFFLLAGIAYCKPVARIFTGAIMGALGRLSFPLYLTHYTVMASLTAFLYIELPVESSFHRMVAAVAISIPVMFMVAWCFEKVVNQPSIHFCKQVSKYLGRKIKKRETVCAIQGAVVAD